MTMPIALVWSLSVLLASAGEPSFDELRSQIREDNDGYKGFLVATLAQMDDPRVVPELIDLLNADDATVRTYADRELVRLADPRSVAALAAALADTNGNVRGYAAEGLAQIGDHRHVPGLVSAVMDHLPDPTGDMRGGTGSSQALDAIAVLSLEAPVELIGLIEDVADSESVTNASWWGLRAETARCLGQIGDWAAYDALQRALNSLYVGHQDYRSWYAADRPSGSDILAADPPLSRRLWIAWTTRQLDAAARQESQSPYQGVSFGDVRMIEPIFTSELVPAIERIIREDRHAVTTVTPRGRFTFYRDRSLAAKFLIEKTGRPYTFVDVDGQTHPGGWDPSQGQ